jgi:nitric-oxide synthase
VSVGVWDDLPALYANVYQMPEVSERALKRFRQTERLDLCIRPLSGEGNLCECMQVKTATVRKLILEGLSSPEEISRRTGAGTVCGGCRPRLVELTGGNAWIPVRIVNIREHNETIRGYELQPLRGRCCACKAGQHVVLEGNIDGLWVARSYTLTAVDEAANSYEVTIKREKHGYFSNWLFSHDRGQIHLRVSQPQGEFTLQPEALNPAVCLVAGIGITPAVAFARLLIREKVSRPLHIDYSVRRLEDAAFRRELTEWPRQYPNIFVRTRLTALDGHLGEAELRGLLSKAPGAEVYICGPIGYEEAMKAFLSAAAVPPDRIHLEQFAHAGAPLEVAARR